MTKDLRFTPDDELETIPLKCRPLTPDDAVDAASGKFWKHPWLTLDQLKEATAERNTWVIGFPPYDLKKGLTGLGSRCYVEIVGLVLSVKQLRAWLGAAFIGPGKRSNANRAGVGIFTTTYNDETFQEIPGFFAGELTDQQIMTGRSNRHFDQRSNRWVMEDKDSPGYRGRFGAHLAIFYEQDGVTLRGRFKHIEEKDRHPGWPVYQVEIV